MQEYSHTNKTQTELLRIYDRFRKVCVDKDLRFFAIGGTCIGAIRHKGFIPWDDDIDIAMPYEDYKKFQQINDFGKDFELYTPYDHKRWKYNFVKLVDANTTFVEKGEMKYSDCYRGFFIDIMPIYGLPKNRYKRKALLLLYDFYLTLNFSIRREISDTTRVRGLIGKIVKFTNNKKSFNRYLEKIEHLFSKYPIDNSEMLLFGWRHSNGFYRKANKYGYVFFSDDFSSSIEVPFEETIINVPKGYDRYLRMDFPGDYMVMPPKDKRIAKHEYDIYDLETPYKSYIEKNKDIIHKE